MDEPRIDIRLPDGSVVGVGPEAVVGRGRVADVRVDDPRVCTVHAELSWRDGRFVILARGGRVLVDGAPVRDAPLAAGARITLAPGVDLEVADLRAGDAPSVPSTAGRDALAFSPCPAGVAVRVGADAEPRLVVDGLAGALLLALLRADGPLRWSALAAALWPEEGALRQTRAPARPDGWTAIDERRFRNRFDQLLASLRADLCQLRAAPWVVVRQGAVELELGLTDRFLEP